MSHYVDEDAIKWIIARPVAYIAGLFVLNIAAICYSTWWWILPITLLIGMYFTQYWRRKGRDGWYDAIMDLLSDPNTIIECTSGGVYLFKEHGLEIRTTPMSQFTGKDDIPAHRIVHTISIKDLDYDAIIHSDMGMCNAHRIATILNDRFKGQIGVSSSIRRWR